MLVREYKVHGKKDLNNIIDLLEVRLEFSNNKLLRRYVDEVRLLNGDRLLIITSNDNGEDGIYSILEITSKCKIHLHKFDKLIELDLYCMNRWWLNVNSFNFKDVDINVGRCLYPVILIGNRIKEVYNTVNRFIFKLFETRMSIDIDSIKAYDSPYVRYVNKSIAEMTVSVTANEDISNIYKLDDNQYLIKTGKNLYKEMVVIDGDIYISIHEVDCEDKVIIKYTRSMSSILDTVVGKVVDVTYDIGYMFRKELNVNEPISQYDINKIKCTDVIYGISKFKRKG